MSEHTIIVMCAFYFFLNSYVYNIKSYLYLNINDKLKCIEFVGDLTWTNRFDFEIN